MNLILVFFDCIYVKIFFIFFVNISLFFNLFFKFKLVNILFVYLLVGIFLVLLIVIFFILFVVKFFIFDILLLVEEIRIKLFFIKFFIVLEINNFFLFKVFICFWFVEINKL